MPIIQPIQRYQINTKHQNLKDESKSKHTWWVPKSKARSFCNISLSTSDQDQRPPRWRQELTIGIYIDKVELSPFGTEGNLHERHKELTRPQQCTKSL